VASVAATGTPALVPASKKALAADDICDDCNDDQNDNNYDDAGIFDRIGVADTSAELPVPESASVQMTGAARQSNRIQELRHSP
jgi:hypothetical protein